MRIQGLQKLDWYIIRKFLVTFFVSIAFLSLIIVIFDISEKIEDFVRKEAPLREIVFDYYVNFVPYFVNQYSPMFVFLTVIFFTSKMTQDSEVVAMLSSGISYHRLMVPYLVSATIIAMLSLTLSLWILPHANATRVQFEQKYNPWRKVKMGHDMHYKLEDDHFVYIESFSAYNNTAYNFTLEDLSTGRLTSKLTAESAQYDTVTGVWKLRNWFIRDYDEGMGDHIRSGRQLDTVISLTKDDFFRNRYTIQELNKKELDELIATQKMRGDATVNMSLIEKNNRYSLPFSALILTIIGVALCTKKKRGGMGWNLAAGTALGFSYILFMQFSEMFESAGMDLKANLKEPVVLQPLQRMLVPTGLYIALPEGYEAQVRPRSGLAIKHGITVLNTPGTVDADYRGEVCVILVNLSQEPFEIVPGERIAQMVIARHEQVEWEEVEILNETRRGAGGFGSTGK